MQDKYKGHPFEILLFPCNQFGGQEPGTPEEIRQYATSNGIRKGGLVKIMEKVDVNGENIHPFFKELKKESGSTGKDILWNFDTKWIIANGNVTNIQFFKTMFLLPSKDNSIHNLFSFSFSTSISILLMESFEKYKQLVIISKPIIAIIIVCRLHIFC